MSYNEYNAGYDEGYRAGMQKMREVGQARIDKLEAKLAKAVEALENLADCVDDGCYCSELRMDTVMTEGRSFLAELKELNQ